MATRHLNLGGLCFSREEPDNPRATILEIIITELGRQHDESRAHGLGRLDLSDPRCALIDGTVDLVALAEAIERG